jgi:hypothetical protein
MPKLDIDILLENNPHLDKEAVKRRLQMIEEAGGVVRRPTKQWPVSPYGRQKRGDARWGGERVRSHPKRISN